MASLVLCGSDRLFLELLDKILLAQGHIVRRCLTGTEALAMLAKRPADLLLCDGAPADLRIHELLQRQDDDAETVVLVLQDGGDQRLPPRMGRCHFLRRRQMGVEELLALIAQHTPSGSVISSDDFTDPFGSQLPVLRPDGASEPDSDIDADKSSSISAARRDERKPTWMKSLRELADDYKRREHGADER